jgi:hypothetical protein
MKSSILAVASVLFGVGFLVVAVITVRLSKPGTEHRLHDIISLVAFSVGGCMMVLGGILLLLDR